MTKLGRSRPRSGACRDIGKNENPENNVPEDLIKQLSTVLQNNTINDYAAEISAEYVLLQENEIIQYIRKDTSGLLESFYYDHIKEGGGEWFLFERDNDIIVRSKIDNVESLYCYYKFSCEGDGYDIAPRAYGKNEDGKASLLPGKAAAGPGSLLMTNKRVY